MRHATFHGFLILSKTSVTELKASANKAHSQMLGAELGSRRRSYAAKMSPDNKVGQSLFPQRRSSMNRCVFLPLSLLALTLSTSALGECTVEIRKYIGNSGGTKTKAIAKAKGSASGLRRNPAFAKLSKKEQMELSDFADEQEKELIADIQSCTETDLASINPSSVTASDGSVASKYVSKDATHCVEIVPKGFKCDGPYDRFLTNICMTKISVRWRLGSDPWGLQELAPKGCTPVSPFRDQRSVQVKACSWDPKASHGPYSDPCRY